MMFSFFKRRKHDANKIFIRDFVIETEIGVNDSEKGRKQRVIINVVIVPKIWPNASHDNINETVSYDDVVKIIQQISASGHVHLVETFAELVAQKCLKNLPIKTIKIKLEKPDIYGFAIPGVEIFREA